MCIRDSLYTVWYLNVSRSIRGPAQYADIEDSYNWVFNVQNKNKEGRRTDHRKKVRYLKRNSHMSKPYRKDDSDDIIIINGTIIIIIIIKKKKMFWGLGNYGL